MRYLVLALSFGLMGCEGFRVTGRMCEKLQPAYVSAQCVEYDDEKAVKASEHKADDKGECLKCKKIEKIEIRR